MAGNTIRNGNKTDGAHVIGLRGREVKRKSLQWRRGARNQRRDSLIIFTVVISAIMATATLQTNLISALSALGLPFNPADGFYRLSLGHSPASLRNVQIVKYISVSNPAPFNPVRGEVRGGPLGYGVYKRSEYLLSVLLDWVRLKKRPGSQYLWRHRQAGRFREGESRKFTVFYRLYTEIVDNRERICISGIPPTNVEADEILDVALGGYPSIYSRGLGAVVAYGS